MTFQAHAVQRSMRGVALTIALWPAACGPGRGSDGAEATAEGTGDEGSSSAASGVSVDGPGSTMASADDSGSGTASSSTGNGVECPDNVANEPYCYRRIELEGISPTSAVVGGRFGPSGEPAIAFLHHDEGTFLLRWTGAEVTLESHDLATPGAHAWSVAALDEPTRDDLVGENLPEFLYAISTANGELQPALTTEISPDAYPYWPLLAIDLDGDALDELLVQYGPNPGVNQVAVLQPYRWDGTSWTPWGDFITPLEDLCGTIWQIKRLHLDDDGRDDLLFSTACRSDKPNEHGFVKMLSTPAPSVFVSELHVVDPPGQVDWLDIADFDGDGDEDVVARTSGYFENPKRVDLLLSAGDGSLSPPQTVWTEGDALYVDYEGDCVDSAQGWNTADLDGDGRSELLCGRTAVISVSESPTIVEAFSRDRIGGEASAQTVAFDVSGDGIDEIVMTIRDTDGIGRKLLLLSDL